MSTAQPSRTVASVVVTVALILVGGACSGAGNVGTGVNTANKNGKSLAFGQETTTSTLLQLTLPPPPATSTTTIARTQPTTAAAPATTAPVRSTTTVAVQSFQIVTINGDNTSQTQFSPSNLAVYVGTPVHFQNKDKKSRSVVSNDGTSFRSPLIPPGGEWIYGAPSPGQFPYQDGTRPYAVASLTVQAR